MASVVYSLSPSHLSTPLFNPSPRLPASSISGLLPPQPQSIQTRKRRVIVAAKSRNGKGKDPSVPSWAQPGSDEAPPWAREEAQKDPSSFAVPFYVYLLASTVTAIAAVGSIFEYVNQRPVFGVLNSDSVFYAPLLGFFVLTGFPFSVFLWFKSVQSANKEAEEQDRKDGYRKKWLRDFCTPSGITVLLMKWASARPILLLQIRQTLLPQEALPHGASPRGHCHSMTAGGGMLFASSALASTATCMTQQAPINSPSRLFFTQGASYSRYNASF